MKLRQKLAMALAAAMVVTSVPVTTMAASTNSFNTTLSLMKDQVITTEDALELRFDLADAATTGKTDVFYVTATDFEFVDADEEKLSGDDFVGVDGVTVEVLSKTQLKVTITATGEVTLSLPVVGQVDGDAPALTVDGEGSVVSSGKYSLLGANASVATKGLEVSVDADTVKNISVLGFGELADIKVEEIVAGQLNGKTLKLELDRSSDLHFNYVLGEEITTFEGERGQAGVAGTITVVEIDENEMVIEFSNFNADQRGAVTLQELEVKPENTREDVPTGEVTLEISAVELNDENKYTSADFFEEVEAVVANVADFGVALTVADDEAVEFVAGGETQEVTITLAELATETLDNRTVAYLTVEGADIVEINEIAIGEAEEGIYKEYEEVEGGAVSTVTFNDDDEIVLDLTGIDAEAISEYELSLTLAVEPQSTEDVVVKAESRDFADLEVVVGTVTEDRTIETEAATLIVGEKGQIGGSISITETEAETFENGEVLFIELEEEAADDDITIEDFEVVVTEDSGLEVETDLTVYYTTANGLTITKPAGDEGDDYQVLDNVIAVEITRESDEAATITVENIEFDTNHRTPEAAYSVVLSGEVVSHDERHEVEIEEFVVVGDVLPESTETQKEVVLAVGSKEYTIDGVTVEGAAAPYIVEGRTMIPLRLVSEAFGAKVDFGTINGVGTVTIHKNGDVLQFQNGTNVMNQNGIQIPMDAVTVIENGTTFVPFRYLANGLGVDFVWDATTQTIAFMN